MILKRNKKPKMSEIEEKLNMEYESIDIEMGKTELAMDEENIARYMNNFDMYHFGAPMS